MCFVKNNHTNFYALPYAKGPFAMNQKVSMMRKTINKGYDLIIAEIQLINWKVLKKGEETALLKERNIDSTK